MTTFLNIYNFHFLQLLLCKVRNNVTVDIHRDLNTCSPSNLDTTIGCIPLAKAPVANVYFL